MGVRLRASSSTSSRIGIVRRVRGSGDPPAAARRPVREACKSTRRAHEHSQAAHWQNDAVRLASEEQRAQAVGKLGMRPMDFKQKVSTQMQRRFTDMFSDVDSRLYEHELRKKYFADDRFAPRRAVEQDEVLAFQRCKRCSGPVQRQCEEHLAKVEHGMACGVWVWAYVCRSRRVMRRARSPFGASSLAPSGRQGWCPRGFLPHSGATPVPSGCGRSVVRGRGRPWRKAPGRLRTRARCGARELWGRRPSGATRRCRCPPPCWGGGGGGQRETWRFTLLAFPAAACENAQLLRLEGTGR